MVRYSLIVPSINRTQELVRLFNSIDRLTVRDFEVILVDQNRDSRLISIVEKYSHAFVIKHIHSDSRGAARARNIGTAVAAGEIILWPDDDCWYPPTILKDIDCHLSKNTDISGIIGILVNEEGQPFTRWTPTKARSASLMDAFIHAREPAIIFRREMFLKVGGFDEAIGTGADTLWGAGESTDLCLRVKKAGGNLIIAPDIRLFHPHTPLSPKEATQRQDAYNYARGMGGILKKNRLNFPFVMIYISTYIRAILWNCFQFKWDYVGYHLARLNGVISGWVKYPE